MRLRLILAFAVVAIASLFTMLLAARQGTASEVRAFMFRGGMAGSGRIVRALEAYYLRHGSWSGVQDVLADATGSGAGGMGRGWGGGMPMMGGISQRLQVADPQGRIVADTDDLSLTGQASEAELRSGYPLVVKGETVGYLLIEGGMAFTVADEQFLVGRLNRAALAAGLISAIVGLILALLLSYSLLRPVRALTTAAAKLGQGDLNSRVQVNGKDEIATLGRTFNAMATSLQQAEASRRALTADIAHELRNPLAVQRASLEALQDGIYRLTPENLQPVLEQNLLLSRLVDDLRILALAESGHLQLERSPVDLAGLVGRVLERFGAQADQRKIRITWAEEGSPLIAPILADAQRLEQILNNLLSNALRYTPEGGKIEVKLAYHKEQVALSLQDNGPGIPSEALPFIFERFYRADKSRARSQGGTGLGLAIARRLAEAHGGSLTADNPPEGGARFLLTLPLQPTA